MIAIAAMGENRVIGNNGKIPWYIPGDFKHFKNTTSGHIILMGRKTFETFPTPLPNREHWVLSRHTTYPYVVNIRDPNNLPTLPAGKKIFVIGGGEIYKLYLPKCLEVILTLVHQSPEGDAKFPKFEEEFAEPTIVEKNTVFSILKYKRKT